MRVWSWIPACAGMTMLSGVAFAQTPVNMQAIDHELAGIQSAINAGSANGSLKPEAAQALDGKQKELTDRAALLEKRGNVTHDETLALSQSITEQENRLKNFSRTKQATRTVDPSALPPPVIEGANGTVTTGGINQPVASPVIAPAAAVPTTIAPNGTVAPSGTMTAPGSISTTVPATNVTPGIAR